MARTGRALSRELFRRRDQVTKNFHNAGPGCQYNTHVALDILFQPWRQDSLFDQVVQVSFQTRSVVVIVRNFHYELIQGREAVAPAEQASRQ